MYHAETVVQLRKSRRPFGEFTSQLPQHETAARIGHACGLCLISHFTTAQVMLQVLLFLSGMNPMIRSCFGALT